VALGAPAALGAGASSPGDSNVGPTQAGKRVTTTQTVVATKVAPSIKLAPLPQWV
jgi:hypothetical protein